MATNGAVKATSENRTWDDAEYEKLARERRENAHNEKINKVIAKESVTVRTENLDLEKKVGTKAKFNAHPDAKRTGKGFWCAVCEMEFLDSSSYVSHINSRFHQSKLGKSMLITESSLSDVKQKLLQHKKRNRDQANGSSNSINNNANKSSSSRYVSKTKDGKQLTKTEIYELKKKQVEEEEALRKKQKRDHRKQQKKDKKNNNNYNNDDDSDNKTLNEKVEEEVVEEEESEEMKQMKLMMGFGSFN